MFPLIFFSFRDRLKPSVEGRESTNTITGKIFIHMPDGGGVMLVIALN